MELQKNLTTVIVDNIVLVTLLSVSAVLIFKWIFRSGGKRLPPGPIGVPFLGYIPFLGEEPQRTFLNLSKKYGNIISLRLGSKLTVIFNDYESAKEGLNNPAALHRGPDVFDHIPNLGLETTNGDEWVEQRRFSIQCMKDLGVGKGTWETLIAEEVINFLDLLRSYKGKPVEISHFLSEAINNNILAMLIGRRLHKDLDKDKIDLVVNYGDVVFSYMGVSHITNLIPGSRKYLEYFKIAGYDRAAKIIADMDDWISKEVRKHKSESKGLTDFITLYLEQTEKMNEQGKKHYFSEFNLEGNFRILFLGASDTIFSSLIFLFRIMSSRQDIQKKVQEELDDVLGRDGRVSYEERSKIPYTYAVVMEGQRFSSIVPLSTTRLAVEDFEVQGYTVPKGAEFFANLWALHFDPKYWKNPDEFIPERFLDDRANKTFNNPPSFAAFSLGRRNCPGQNIAFMEILVFFSSVLQKFNISPPPGEDANFEIINGLVTRLKKQPLCYVERTFVE